MKEALTDGKIIMPVMFITGGGIGTAVPIMAGSIISLKSGMAIGALAGAIGGPVGIGIGAALGAMFCLIAGYYLKKKWESEDRETALMMTNQQKDTRIQDLERRVNQLSRDTVRQKHVISLLESMLDLLEKRAMFLKKENLFLRQKIKEHDDKFNSLVTQLASANINIKLTNNNSISSTNEESKGAEEGIRMAQKKLGELLKDQIELTKMKDPVVADDGRTYDRAVLQRWYDTCLRKHNPPTCPVSRLPLTDPRELKPCTYSIRADLLIKDGLLLIDKTEEKANLFLRQKIKEHDDKFNSLVTQLASVNINIKLAKNDNSSSTSEEFKDGTLEGIGKIQENFQELFNDEFTSVEKAGEVESSSMLETKNNFRSNSFLTSSSSSSSTISSSMNSSIAFIPPPSVKKKDLESKSILSLPLPENSSF